MNGRRGFFALIGGAAITGAVQRAASAEVPTLILPQTLVVPKLPVFSTGPHEREWEKILRFRQNMTDERFAIWMQLGEVFANQERAAVEGLS